MASVIVDTRKPEIYEGRQTFRGGSAVRRTPGNPNLIARIPYVRAHPVRLWQTCPHSSKLPRHDSRPVFLNIRARLRSPFFSSNHLDYRAHCRIGIYANSVLRILGAGRAFAVRVEKEQSLFKLPTERHLLRLYRVVSFK